MAALSFHTGSPVYGGCNICFEPLADAQESDPVVTHEGEGKKHPFHQRCIEQIRCRADGRRYCPICRSHLNIYSLTDSQRPFPLNHLMTPVRTAQERVLNPLYSTDDRAFLCRVLTGACVAGTIWLGMLAFFYNHEPNT